MKMDSGKEAFERNSVELLKERIGDFPQGAIRMGRPPQPDCLIGEAPFITGIEVTRLHHEGHNGGRPPREQEAERTALVVEAQGIYEREGLHPLEVHISFSDVTAFTKYNRMDYARKLAALVSCNVITGQAIVTITNNYADASSFPWEIDYLSIASHPVLTRNHWSVVTSGFITEDFRDRLQQEISKKDRKLEGYRMDCDRVWLLIVSENNSPSTAFDPSPATIDHLYTASFERLFLLDQFRGRVYELK